MKDERNDRSIECMKCHEEVDAFNGGRFYKTADAQEQTSIDLCDSCLTDFKIDHAGVVLDSDVPDDGVWNALVEWIQPEEAQETGGPIVEPTKITVSFEMPCDLVAHVAKSIMENFPECSCGCTLACIGFRYRDNEPIEQWVLEFRDDEQDGRVYRMRGPDFERVIPVLFTDKWPKALPTPPATGEQDAWDDWLCHCDADAFDAIAQLVCLGEVIYG